MGLSAGGLAVGLIGPESALLGKLQPRADELNSRFTRGPEGGYAGTYKDAICLDVRLEDGRGGGMGRAYR